MKTKLTLLLLFFCLLPMAAQVVEDDQHWTEFVSDTKIAETKESETDIVYELKNEIPTYTIYTAKGLAWVAKVTNDGLKNEVSKDETKYYPAKAGFEDCTIELGEIEGGKLNISGHKWVPIGYDKKYFYGTFDGNNQEITGLRIEEENVTDNNYYGLFGVTNGATIKNFGIQIETFSIDGESINNSQVVYVGGIAGYVDASEISNCYVYGEKGGIIQVENIGPTIIGGLVGEMRSSNSSITNSYSMIDIIANSNKQNAIGSIAGNTIGLISNTFATGSIVVDSPVEESFIGGICGGSFNATLKNNLALNKGGITVNGVTGGYHYVGYINGDDEATFTDNYVSPNFAILGEGITYNKYEEATIIDTDVDLATILNDKGSSSPAWKIPTDGSLPYLSSFTKVEQPAKDKDNGIKIIPRLKLDDKYADYNIISISYNKQQAQWEYTDAGNGNKPFNGEISGTEITKEVYITGGAEDKDVPTLTIVGDLEISNSSGNGMTIVESVNLTVAEGNKLNISGQWGLVTNGNITLNQSLSKLRDTGNGGITIVGTEYEGIQNQRTLNINVDKQTVKVNSNDFFVITNLGTLNCNTGLIEINGYSGIYNDSDNDFNIQGAEITINQGGGNAIQNSGTFSISPTGTLNILTSDGSQPKIANKEGATFTLEPGATFITWLKGATKPTAYTLTYSSTKDETISITDEYGINYQSGSKLCAGTDLTVTVSGNTKEIGNVIYTQADGTKEIATPTGAAGTYTFTMPELATEVSVKFKADPEPEPEPDDDDDDSGVVTPTVYYTVTLPEVEGATLDPGAGDYDVESWSTFRFYLTLAPEYDQSLPIVTTDRGETIAPRQSDGAYLVKFVRTNVAITIDGIVKNPDPVANDAVDADNITIRRTADGLLIHVPSPETLTLYTFAGTLVRTIHLPAGDTRIDVPTGIYIVRVGTKVEKVIL